MTDLELATAFFKRIQEKGFELKFNHHAYGQIDDLSEPHYVCIDLYSSESETDGAFCVFDFDCNGAFHRISGFTRGHWQDEVDWKKY